LLNVRVVSRKDFKTEAQLTQHLTSKVHRKKAQEVEKSAKSTKKPIVKSVTPKVEKEVKETIIPKVSDDLISSTSALGINEFPCLQCDYVANTRNQCKFFCLLYGC
jgi:hypothetical protein